MGIFFSQFFFWQYFASQPAVWQMLFLHYRSSSPNDFKFSMDLVHRIIRQTVKNHLSPREISQTSLVTGQNGRSILDGSSYMRSFQIPRSLALQRGFIIMIMYIYFCYIVRKPTLNSSKRYCLTNLCTWAM